MDDHIHACAQMCAHVGQMCAHGSASWYTHYLLCDMHVCGMCCEHRYDIQLAQLLTKDSGTPMGHNAAFLELGDTAGPVFTEDLPV